MRISRANYLTLGSHYFGLHRGDKKVFTSYVTHFLVSISCYLEDTYDLNIFQMDLLNTHDMRRFANGKECIFKLSGVLISLSAFMLEVVIAIYPYWRLWEFNDNRVQFVCFGLWEAHYSQELNVSGTITKILVHIPINSTWFISPEFKYAQNLIIWAILMKPVVLVFSAMATKISCMKNPVIEMQIYCYKLAALVLCISSLFTFVSVSWNYFADHYGQTILEFPHEIPVKKEALKSKHFTAVFPLAVLTATMSLFGVIIFLSEISSLKLQSQVKTKYVSKVSKEET